MLIVSELVVFGALRGALVLPSALHPAAALAALSRALDRDLAASATVILLCGGFFASVRQRAAGRKPTSSRRRWATFCSVA